MKNKVRVLVLAPDGELLDDFHLWEGDRPEHRPATLSQRMRDYLERRYEVKEVDQLASL